MLSRKDLLYLAMCQDEARRFSTCVRRQVFALIVDTYGHIIGTGYNGVASGLPHCVDGGCPRGQSDAQPGSTYEGNCHAAHAELNALLHSSYTARREGCTLFVNSTPCWGCGIAIAHGSVTRVVCLHDSLDAQWPLVRTYLERCGVEVEAIALAGIS